MKILNLTQHPATPEQIEAGVIDPGENWFLADLLTFDSLPLRSQIETTAQAIARYALAYGADAAMIGGAPYLMGPLESSLNDVGITPLYAFSKRESVEQTQEDGSVRKVNVFHHLGFVWLD